MMTDPIADFLVRIKNSYLAERKEVTVPWSKFKERLAKVLLAEGYIADKKIAAGAASKKELVLELKYNEGKSVITEIKRVSRPGRRVYVGSGSLPVVLGGRGIAVVSTPAGVMTAKEAKKKNLGGEVICEIW